MISGDSNRILILLCFCMAFLSCRPQNDDPGLIGQSAHAYYLCNRRCEILTDGDPSFHNDHGEMAEILGIDWPEIVVIVTSEDMAEVTDVFEGGKMTHRINGDKLIEDQIIRQVTLSGYEGDFFPADSEPQYPSVGMSTYSLFEYRTEECVSVSISSSVGLFGRSEGCDVTDRFMISNIFDAALFGPYLITYDGQLKEPLQEMSVNAYLSYRPMVLPRFMFKLTETPPEAPVETDFIIKIGLANGKVLTNKTHVSLKSE